MRGGMIWLGGAARYASEKMLFILHSSSMIVVRTLNTGKPAQQNRHALSRSRTSKLSSRGYSDVDGDSGVF